MASARVLQPPAFGTALPRVPKAIPSLPQIGAKVRVTTNLSGLSLEGTLVSVNLFQGTLTLQTSRFGCPLTIQAGNVSHLQELEPPADNFGGLEHAEAAEAAAARQAAAGVARLVSAVKAVALSPILSALPTPAGMNAPAVERPPSPALSASSHTSGSSGSSLKATSSVFKSSSAVFVPSVARPASPPVAQVVSTPPVMYRTASAPSVPELPRHFAPPGFQAVSMAPLPPPGIPVATVQVARSMSYAPASALPTSVVASMSPPRMYHSDHMDRPRSVSPARSTASDGSAASNVSSASSTRSAKMAEVCKYFNTSKGCSRGTACRYRHAPLPEGVAPMVDEPAFVATKSSPPQSSTRRSRRRHHSRRNGRANN